MLPIALGALHDSFGGYGAGPDPRRRRRRRRVRRRRPAARRLAPRLGRHRRSARVMVKTGCPYCGVGCGLVAEVRDGRLHAVRGDEAHPVNRGLTCRKPLALPEAVARRRPRAASRSCATSQDERFRDATWDEALDHVAARLLAIRAEHGPSEIAFYISGQLLTEDYYAVNKLAKGYLGTNNVDSNSRLCMSSRRRRVRRDVRRRRPAARLRRPRADATASCCWARNTGACHPILWGRIRAAQERGRDADRRRPAPHRQRRRRRHPPADQAGHGPRAAERVDRRATSSRATGTRRRAAEACGVPEVAIERAAARVRRRGAVDGAVVDGRQPVRSRASRSTARC